jgi:TolA-binding protein
MISVSGRTKERGRAGIPVWGAILLLSAACLIPSDAWAQATPRELRQNANNKLAKGAFEDAISDLEQLIQYLGESKDDRIKASMDAVFYNLAICYFFVGSFDKADERFKDYIKRYPHGIRARTALVYIADTLRFRNQLDPAIKAYNDALAKYGLEYSKELKADMYSAIARCLLAQDKWKEAIEPLMQTYVTSPDFLRRNWAATLLTTAYFKQLDLDKVYPLVPFLLRPNSFASHSIAFSLAALEAGDQLFAEERYRDALWIFRMVYPYDTILLRSEEYLNYLKKLADDVREQPGDPRRLMRLQETIGELEEEVKALQGVPNYDLELYSRIARGYMEMFRFWEGREIFLHLHDVGDPKLAEQSLFLAFRCSTYILPWDRAYEIGEQYMKQYPGGEWYDMLTLMVGQMYAKQQNWPKVIEHFKKVLEVSPKHESMADCYFLIGYASFMEELFPQAVDYFTRITRQFEGNELVPPSTYWAAMAYLFDGKYEEGAAEFDRLLNNFPGSLYAEDAAFRRSVCAYGLSQFEESEKRLGVFTRAYPKSKLTSEATMMRGDIAGALGNLKEAIAFYKQAMTYDDLNIEYYNHCAFQAGRLLGDEEDWAGMIGHFRGYVEKNREGSNVPLAVYWIGIGLWNQGEEQGAMRYYREAVEKYGKDVKAMGIDLILDEWVGRTKRANPEAAKKAWNELAQSLVNAMRVGDKVMELRLRRVLVYHPEMKDGEKQRVIRELLNEANFPNASPSVLEAMLQYAREGNQDDFAIKVANYIVENYLETDYALDARMMLAQIAIERAKKAETKDRANVFYDEATKHLEVIRAVFATTGEAAQSLMLLGKIYFDQGKIKESDECYKSVLGVKDWRNYWPEALHGRGECAFQERQYEQASAYYERIYVMYSHYKGWTAKAYIRRAECLRRLYQNTKAVEVLKEMLDDPDLAAMPEGREGKEMLIKMGISS